MYLKYLLPLFCGVFFASITYGASYGTGFFITTDGYIVTNSHVIEEARVVTIRTKDGQERVAQIVRIDKRNDLAILKVSGKNFKFLPIASSSGIKRGEKVYAMGFPRVDIQGIEPKLTEGIISSLSGIRDEPTTFQISNAIQPGNSGGPLFNSDGRVIGVVVSTLNPLLVLQYSGSLPQNVNYAVKSNYLLELLNSIGSEKINNSGSISYRGKKFTDIVELVEEAVVLIKSTGDKNQQRASTSSKNQEPSPKSNPVPPKVVSGDVFNFSGVQFSVVNGYVTVISVSDSSTNTFQKNDRISICYNNAVAFGGTRVGSLHDLKICFKNHWSNTIFRTYDGLDRDYFGAKLM